MLKRTLVFILLYGFQIAVHARWSHMLPQLAKEDTDLIQLAARVQMTGKPVGTTLKWSNSKTGNAGTVTLMENFEHEGRKCRTNRHVITQQATGPKTYVISICQNRDGTWQIVPRNKDR
jgi:surface antigen